MSVSSLTLSDSERLVNRLRNVNPEKYRSLVKMHLSFLLHLPGTSLDEFIKDEPCTPAPPDAKPRGGIFSGFGKSKKSRGR